MSGASEKDLVAAAEEGNAERVQELLAAGIGVDAVDSDGCTALMAAAARGHTDCTEVLIRAKAEVDKGDNEGETALMKASQGGHLDCVNALVAAGSLVNAVDMEGDTALLYGASHRQIVEVLVAAGGNLNVVDNFGDTILVSALRQGSCLSALISAGVDVNAASQSGCTALMEAATRGDTEATRVLIDAGANVNQGETTAEPSCTRLLLKSGAWVNNTEQYGFDSEASRPGEPGVTFGGEKHLLLLAAGQRFPPHCSQSEEENFNLQNLCREVIRDHLLHLNPNENLFLRIPKLPVPEPNFCALFPPDVTVFQAGVKLCTSVTSCGKFEPVN